MISAVGLTKRFRGTPAVDDLSFDVRPGVVTGFLGPNGAGKSTTMRLLLGLDHADAGTGLFDGRRYVDLPNPLREVGSLLDAGAAHPGRRARDHLWFQAAAAGIPKRRVDETLAMVGLTEAARKRVGELSLGMQQRLGLAAALLGDPGTLLLDEPANGLDPEGILWIRNFLTYLAAQGRTVFVSSHLLGEMAQMADELVVIGRGRLIAAGSVQDFVTRFTSSWVRVRSPQAATLVEAMRQQGAQVEPVQDGAFAVHGPEAAEVGEAAARLGVVLHELTTVTASLEEAFLEVTRGAQEFRAVTPPRPGAPLPPPQVPS